MENNNQADFTHFAVFGYPSTFPANPDAEFEANGGWNNLVADYSAVIDLPDYDNVGSTSFGSIEADSGVTTDSSTYNAITLNGSGEAAIATSGITKLAMRWEADRADAEPSSATAGCQIIILSADQSGTSTDPKLVITHAAPAFIPEVRFF